MFGPKHIGAMNDLDLSGSPDVIGHVIIRFAMGHFLFVYTELIAASVVE